MIRFRRRHAFIAAAALFVLCVVIRSFPFQRVVVEREVAPFKCPTVEAVEAIEELPVDSSAKKIVCNVDGVKNYKCWRDEEDVYLPFEKFLRKQFDASGKLFKGDRGEADRFEWWTSYSKVRFPDEGQYDPTGSFGHFASYSVENRDRVRCISAEYGVPMSTQWSPRPYFYPIQIAQYALQYYSRNKTDDEPVSVSLGEETSEWIVEGPAKEEVVVSQFFEKSVESNVVEIIPQGKRAVVKLLLNNSTDLDVISFLWKADSSGSFTIIAEIVQSKEVLHLHYVHRSDGRCVWQNEDQKEMAYFYELGAHPNPLEWRSICRSVLVDVSRALATASTGKKNPNSVQLHPGDVRALSITFEQHSWIRNLQQRSAAHLERFLVAADWFISNQDQYGGWPVPVERSIAEKKIVLKAGWHSAMAQGHAMSVLTRAYSVTHEYKYLRAAVKATLLFKINASENGVRGELFGHPWYEEYPTQPGTFVLNGFMYSLIGLYELSLMPKQFSGEADKLFQEGIEALKALLPLFDTGSGSTYDLRHVGLKTAPNLARWDYHTVHIYLLKWLYNITKEEQLNETANRWAAYAQGK
uniref:heparosan-N-sulfate-glucuronate 5-epimerase n=1 Tax=Parascaris univalens TaxID=6257 RepID=A0A914ZVE7_PARUN